MTDLPSGPARPASVSAAATTACVLWGGESRIALAIGLATNAMMPIAMAVRTSRWRHTDHA